MRAGRLSTTGGEGGHPTTEPLADYLVLVPDIRMLTQVVEHLLRHLRPDYFRNLLPRCLAHVAHGAEPADQDALTLFADPFDLIQDQEDHPALAQLLTFGDHTP